MNAARVTPPVQSPKRLFLVPSPTQPSRAEALIDPHPLVPVLIAGGIAATTALLFVGSILMWLVVRQTGINAPW